MHVLQAPKTNLETKRMQVLHRVKRAYSYVRQIFVTRVFVTVQHVHGGAQRTGQETGKKNGLRVS